MSRPFRGLDMFGLVAACAITVAAIGATPPASEHINPRTHQSNSPTHQSTNSPIASRSPILTSLHVSFAGLQIADIHSTSLALGNCGVEANPAMRGIVSNRAAFIAAKAAAGVTTIWMTEKLRKKHPKAALALMVALNSFMATVVAHNSPVR